LPVTAKFQLLNAVIFIHKVNLTYEMSDEFHLVLPSPTNDIEGLDLSFVARRACSCVRVCDRELPSDNEDGSDGGRSC